MIENIVFREFGHFRAVQVPNVSSCTTHSMQCTESGLEWLKNWRYCCSAWPILVHPSFYSTGGELPCETQPVLQGMFIPLNNTCISRETNYIAASALENISCNRHFIDQHFPLSNQLEFFSAYCCQFCNPENRKYERFIVS